MTAKNLVTRMYHAKKEIEVLASSLDDFLLGRNTTIDHIVIYENQRQIVRSKPPVKDYKNYRLISNWYYDDLKY